MTPGTLRARLRLLAVTVAGGLALLLSTADSASAAPPYPVSYNFLDAIVAQQSPDAPPPGANDPSCRPSDAHPEPVVLVHGLFANRTVNWNTVSPLLANDGYCVWALTYGTKDNVTSPLYQPGGLKKMEESAGQLSAFIDEVLAKTGASKVDIVGHSEGSLMPNYYVKFLGGAAKVDDYVGIATIWDGTEFFGAATVNALGTQYGFSAEVVGLLNQFCESCVEFLHGSEFMEKMRAGGVAHPAVTYTNIVTRYDELVTPYTSGLMPPGPNVTNHVAQDHCELDLAEHMALVADPVATILVLNALAPEHPRPVPCQPVLPAIGAPGATPPAPLDSDGDSDPDFSDPCPTVAGQTSCPRQSESGSQLGALAASKAGKAKRKCKRLRKKRARRRCLRRARR